jgi:hypothetical protein
MRAVAWVADPYRQKGSLGEVPRGTLRTTRGDLGVFPHGDDAHYSAQ